MTKSFEKYHLFLKMMAEVYPHLVKKSESLKAELEGILPANFFFEVDEQLEKLQQMEVSLKEYVEKYDQQEKKIADATSTASAEDIFNIDLSSFMKDVDE